ncbi:MAG: sugar phosphate isomerase/epimerase [Firmicutes bacterium]|nr:sugar phosphate isomerase/epimerase [Bacillota bacterium]
MHYTMYTRFNELLNAVGPEAAADRAKEMGFESVEMFSGIQPSTISDVETARQVRQIFEKRGLHFACYSVYADLYESEKHIELMMLHADLAAALGSPYLHFTILPWLSLDETKPSIENGISFAVDAAERVARHAEPLGVTCIFEDQGMYLNGIENFGKFFYELKSRCSNVGVCGDVGNILFVDEDPAPFFEAFKEDLKHVHIKDYLRKPAGFDPVGRYWLPTRGRQWLRDTMIGSGVIDFKACMDVLKSIGYDGPLALELGHPEPFDVGVQQAMEYLNRFL